MIICGSVCALVQKYYIALNKTILLVRKEETETPKTKQINPSTFYYVITRQTLD